MSIDTSVGRVEGVRVSIDTSVQVSGQGSSQDRGMRAKIGQVIRGALEGALNQTTANDTGRAGGAGPPGSGGGWAEGNG